MQEDVCTPEDILALRDHSDHDHDHDHSGHSHQPDLLPLASTVTALLAHATPKTDTTYARAHDPYEHYTSDAEFIEVNYYKRQLRRYSEDSFVSNFNFDQPYTIDESEEYQLNYENNNADQNVSYSPVYDGLRQRPYYQNNRVQFVQPFCKDRVLQSDNFEIYDTDEVDFPVEVAQEMDVQRYDRGKMNLDIQDNLNRDLKRETEPVMGNDNRLLFTCLCLGTFFVSTVLLILYPL